MGTLRPFELDPFDLLWRDLFEANSTFDEDAAIYRGIKKSSFDLTWKISTKFDLSQLKAALDKGLLTLDIPIAEGKAIRKIEIATPTKQLK